MTQKYFKQPSVMNAQQHFSQVPSAEIPRSKFDRSHKLLTTYDAGRLIPIYCDEVLPGDTHTVTVTQAARVATLKFPIMDNLYLDQHFWFVPMRLVWDNWQKFMGERINPDDDPNDFSIPQTTIVLGDIQPTSAAGYFGLPFRDGVGGVEVSALIFRAYTLIYNEWYRDQNMQDSISFSTGDGPDDWSHFTDADSCYPRGKRKDYFTSCLPWPQKGDPVIVPIGGNAPIVIPNDDRMMGGTVEQQNQIIRRIADNSSRGTLVSAASSALQTTIGHATDEDAYIAAGVYINDPGGAYADLGLSSTVTINDLRTAFQIQRLLERDARGGTRYIESIFAHFGVRSDDARLQRPEYLGGSSKDVSIVPIANTTGTAELPQASLAALGTGNAVASFQKSFTEHGLIIGLACARADLTYSQGIHPMWTRKTRYEHYYPVFAHLGEQAVKNREIFVQGNVTDDEVFGYQERWAEYRYGISRFTGLMAPEQPTSLDAWHLGQEFESLPALNSAFISEDPPLDRCIAVPSEPHFNADFWFHVESERPMPIYSVPGLIDHF